MKELPKAYEPKNYEDKIYKKWEKSGLFNPDVCVERGFTKKNAKPFSIVLPPPNVTGTLHMGHAAMLAIEDVMVRYHRMKGDRTLWVPGTDHAAIATQAKVEKLVMEKENKTKYDLGRDEFLKRVEKFAQESHDTIVNQCKKMGASLDWSREAYTLDDKRNLAVRTVFKKMYDDGLIYRGYRVINWSVKGQSTVSDDELVHVERPAKLYYFKYAKDFPITIATTRPETKLGDTAVAVNPKDLRYKKYIGKTYKIEKFANTQDLEIKIIADESIDMDFGTGAVGLTPAHSTFDYDLAEKHGLLPNGSGGLLPVIDEQGKIKDYFFSYGGMLAEDARKNIVEFLRDQDLLEKEEDIVQNVGTSDRFGDIIEPLPKTQWFIDVNKPIKSRGKKTLKQLMQKAVGDKKDQIEIIPDRFNKTYFHWIDNLRDWCISRQIWYGHQIPVWYKGEEIYVNVKPPKGEGWQQDPDTLDTWFSSGLWTFSTLGYPDLKAKDLKNYHPTSVMETGYDILFFWVARMILMTTYVLGDIPFKTVYLHGLVRDEKGAKMSKSLGNVIDPLDMINKYGTDATRLSLLVGNTPGNDMKLSEEKIAGFRNFTNKLWNISRFMLINIDEPKMGIKKPAPVTDFDKYILLELDILIGRVDELFEKFNFSFAGEVLRHFTWSVLADWYLEAAKIEGNKSDILNYLLNTLLKLWHPYMPFVTETIWQQLYGESEILMIKQWPKSSIVVDNIYKDGEVTGYNFKSLDRSDIKDFVEAKNNISKLEEIITNIRGIRAGANIEAGKKISVSISASLYVEFLKRNTEVIKDLRTGIDKLTIEKEIEKPENAIRPYIDGVEVFVNLEGAIDKEKRKEVVEKEIAATESYIKQLINKLSNKDFENNAPLEVRVKEMHKLNEANDKLDKLKVELNYLKSI